MEHAGTVTDTSERADEEKTIDDDDNSDKYEIAGPSHIKSVDERVLSDAKELHHGDSHPALVGVDHDLTKEEAGVQVTQQQQAKPAEPVRGVNVNAYNGSLKFVTLEMMAFEQDYLIGKNEVRTLKNVSASHPKMLLGWQVTLDVNVKPDCEWLSLKFYQLMISCDFLSQLQRSTSSRTSARTPCARQSSSWCR